MRKKILLVIMWMLSVCAYSQSSIDSIKVYSKEMVLLDVVTKVPKTQKSLFTMLDSLDTKNNTNGHIFLQFFNKDGFKQFEVKKPTKRNEKCRNKNNLKEEI